MKNFLELCAPRGIEVKFPITFSMFNINLGYNFGHILVLFIFWNKILLDLCLSLSCFCFCFLISWFIFGIRLAFVFILVRKSYNLGCFCAHDIWRFKKKKLSSTLILKFLDFTKPFKVHTNSSDFTIGGVLMHEGHSITFESKKLYGTHLKWPIHEKEFYTVVCCLKTWQHYLTTHKTRTTFPWNILKPNQRLQQSN